MKYLKVFEGFNNSEISFNEYDKFKSISFSNNDIDLIFEFIATYQKMARVSRDKKFISFDYSNYYYKISKIEDNYYLVHLYKSGVWKLGAAHVPPITKYWKCDDIDGLFLLFKDLLKGIRSRTIEPKAFIANKKLEIDTKDKISSLKLELISKIRKVNNIKDLERIKKYINF